MGKGTKIEWAHHTFNPWWGCVKVSPACAHCYAETWAKRTGHAVWGRSAPRRFFGNKHWNEPVRWDREAGDGYFYLACPKCGVNVNYGRNAFTDPSATECFNCDELITARPARPRVFCASMADWLEDREDLTPHLARLLALIHATPHLDWLLLTKRPENFKDRMHAANLTLPDDSPFEMISQWIDGMSPPNVWVGTTVENQEVIARHRDLMAIPARVHFWSAEPLLSELDVRLVWEQFGRPDWVICGGESGPGARYMEPRWAVLLQTQCAAWQVPFFFKQRGEWDDQGNRVGKLRAGRLLNGREWNEVPKGGQG